MSTDTLRVYHMISMLMKLHTIQWEGNKKHSYPIIDNKAL